MKPSIALKKDTPKMDPKAKLEELRKKIADKKNGTAAGTSPATNPPESAQALEETAKEVENKVPTPAAETPAEPKIEDKPTQKRGPGRPSTKPATPSTDGLPKPNSVEGIVEHLAALADILPKNFKITIELTPGA